MITNAIGGGRLGVSVDIIRTDARAGDWLLLCSDGLTDQVSDSKLRQILYGAPDPEAATAVAVRALDGVAASAQLVQTALEAGGQDNVTALVVAFELA